METLKNMCPSGNVVLLAGGFEQLGVDHLYESSEGNHSWKWWDIHVQSGLDYLLAK